MGDITIQVPEAVLDAVNFLEKSENIRLETLLKLTQPRTQRENGGYYEANHYEKMWCTLAKHEERRGIDVKSYQWVLDFVDDVNECQALPKYYYIQNESRLELIKELLSLKDNVVRIFLENKNSLNPRLIKALNRKDSPEKKVVQNPVYQNHEIDLIEALEFYTDDLIKSIASVDNLQKDSVGIEKRMFIIALIKRNQFLYQKNLLEIVAVVVWALFGVYKDKGTLSNIKKRAQEI